MKLDDVVENALIDYTSISIDTLKSLYNEPHRHYHTWEHIVTMLDSHGEFHEQDAALLLAILFHDAAYNPKSKTNEEESVKRLKFAWDEEVKDTSILEKAIELILSTKDHKVSNEITVLDMQILDADFNTLLTYEEGIRKEYQYLDYVEYKKGRLEFLSRYADKPNIAKLIEYVEWYKPKIGIYAGSFNPFHVGHMDVLIKAEKMFDKVIVAYGQNLEKEKRVPVTPHALQFRQVDTYDRSIMDYLDSKEYDVTLIRGFRTHKDIEDDFSFIQTIRDYIPSISVTYIPCEAKYSHISSSMLRQLYTLGHDTGGYMIW